MPKYFLICHETFGNAHAQNTLMTDSNQMKKIWIILLNQTTFGPKMFFLPNIFGPKFALALRPTVTWW